MGYLLGIDIGASFSAAATIDDGDASPTMVSLGHRAPQLPSVIYARDDGSLVVGEQAEHLALTDPTRVVREFKRRMGDPVPLVVSERRYRADLMMAQVLRSVVDQTAQRRGERPSHVTLTHPVAWTRDSRIDRLHLAAKMAGLPTISTCPEPVAAALSYASKNLVEVGDRICVCDLGGGTFDVCVLARTAAGFQIVGFPGGESLPGGVEVDTAITDKITGELPALFAAVDPDDPGLYRFRQDCAAAKEALSVDVSTTIQVILGGSTTSVRLTRAKLEAMIGERLSNTIDRIRLELSAAGVGVAELRSFVLVGGSSRMPIVTERLTDAFRCTVARNGHPEHEVALGAALAGRLENRQAQEAVVDGANVPVVPRAGRGAGKHRWLRRPPSGSRPRPRRPYRRGARAGPAASAPGAGATDSAVIQPANRRSDTLPAAHSRAGGSRPLARRTPPATSMVAGAVGENTQCP